jgi:tetratricopeptide (TPR) repeat protein
MADIIRRADQCRDSQNPAQAALLYGQYLDFDQNNFGIWVQFGNALKDSGQFADAEIAYRKAIEIDGMDYDVFLQLGHLLKLSGRQQQALEMYQKSFQIKPTADAETEIVSLNSRFSELNEYHNLESHLQEHLEGDSVADNTTRDSMTNVDNQNRDGHTIPDIATAKYVARSIIAALMRREPDDNTVHAYGSSLHQGYGVRDMVDELTGSAEYSQIIGILGSQKRAEFSSSALMSYAEGLILSILVRHGCEIKLGPVHTGTDSPGSEQRFRSILQTLAMLAATPA